MTYYNDLKLRIFGPLVLFTFGIFLFRFNIHFSDDDEVRFRYLVVGFSFHYICWFIARSVILKIQKNNPGLELQKRRLILLLVMFLPVFSILAYLMRHFTHQIWLGFPNPLPPIADFSYGVGIQVFYHCIYIGTYEGLYVIHQWRKTFSEKEDLIRAQWQSRFDLLKNQINPHFLFNALNTLSGLIQEDPKKAEDYVDEMSKVYRYLLQNTQNEITTLSTELHFLESYFHLLKVRFENGIHLNINIPPQYFDFYIPPLTLQILMENAIKHNIVSTGKPLYIDIFIENDEYVVIKNNLQLKTLPVKSHGVGLHNIATKFRLFGQNEVIIIENGTDFIVKLPLIKQLNTFIFSPVDNKPASKIN